MTNRKYNELVLHLTDAAREITASDLVFRNATWEQFIQVMWPDNKTMDNFNATRREFSDALYDAFQNMRHGEEL